MTLLASAERVLVRAPSWLGDFVAAEPVVRALHGRLQAERRAADLTLCAPAPFLALVAPVLPGARLLPAPRGATPQPGAWRGHDLALLLDGSLRSAWAALRDGVPERVGWSGSLRGPFLTRALRSALERGETPLDLGVHARLPRRLPRPFAAACRELAALAGLEVRDAAPRLVPDARALDSARARLARAGIEPAAPFALVNAGARPDSAKGADPGVLAELCDALAIPCALACAGGEEANARETAAQSVRRHALLDDPPPDLVELTALLSLAALAITPDSGPRHLAQALGTPVLVLFGPTDPRHAAEYGPRVRTLVHAVPCRPCHRERCPLSGDRRLACRRHPAEALLQAADVRLASARGPAS